MGLGPNPDVSLSEARNLATRERKKVLKNIDSLSDKRARRIAARAAYDNMLSFGECAELYIESQAPGWSYPKHIEHWRSLLKNLAGPTIGHLSIDQDRDGTGAHAARQNRGRLSPWRPAGEAYQTRGRLGTLLQQAGSTGNGRCDPTRYGLTVRPMPPSSRHRPASYARRTPPRRRGFD